MPFKKNLSSVEKNNRVSDSSAETTKPAEEKWPRFQLKEERYFSDKEKHIDRRLFFYVMG